MAKSQIKAGFGRGELRFPPEMFPVEGFIGVHDAPCARVMVLETGGIRAAIAALELVNVPPRGIELCQSAIEEKTGTPRVRVWVHVTHPVSTMHEPGPMGPPDRRPPESEEDRAKKRLYYQAIEQAVTEAAQQAADSFGPARLGWGTGRCEVNCNRDVETPFGWWVGLDPDGASNKTMTIFRAEDLDGKPKGFWISYGLKPCALDMAGMRTQDRQVSSDVAGAGCRVVEEKFGVPALFCCSAGGDQMPREQAFVETVTPDGKAVPQDDGVAKGLEIVERLGAEMGRDAIAIAEGIQCGETEGELHHRTASFPWKVRKEERRRRGPGPAPSYEEDGERAMELELITLGDAAFVAEKPEVNCQTELELKEQSPFRHTCLICMVNGGMKYMPDRLAYERNTFEAQSSMLMPGAAEKFVETAAAALRDMAAQEDA